MTVLERTNVRTLTLADLGAADPAYEPCPLVVADLSFISLRSVVPALTGPVSTPDADLVLLVKPQFEAGRAAVSRGKGVIRDPALWLGALEGVASALHDAKTGIMGAMVSPLTGSAGNVEFLVHARKGMAAGRGGGGRRPVLRRRVGGGRTPSTDRSGRLSRRSPMATVTFLVHPDRPDALALATDTAAWLTERGDVARILQFSGPDQVSEAGIDVELADVDFGGTTVAVSMGGDGTFLRVVRLAATEDVPVLGRELRPPGLPARPAAGPGPRRPHQGVRGQGDHRIPLRARRVDLGPFGQR